MFNMQNLYSYGMRRLPKTPITLKVPNGTYSLDPVTKKRTENFTIQQVYGYVGYFDERTIANSNNKLSLESRKVILEDVTVTPDTIVSFEGKEYVIATMQVKGNIVVLGVNPK